MHLKKTFARIITSMLAVTAASMAGAQGEFFDFNEAGKWDYAFYKTGPQIFRWEAAGGIDDTPWITNERPNNSIAGMLVLDRKFPGNQSEITLGIYFQWKGDAPASSTMDALTLGIGRSDDASERFVPSTLLSEDPNVATTQQLHIGIALTSEEDVVKIHGGEIVDQEKKFFAVPEGKSAQLVQGNWYYMEVEFRRALIDTGYDVTLRLYESDASGVKGAEMLSGTVTRYNAALINGDVQPFIAVRTVRYSNIVGIDNFSLTTTP